jgi:hypothetical protein
VLLVSCYPVQENPPRKHKAGTRANQPPTTQTEQAKNLEQRERQQRAEDENNKQNEAAQQNPDAPIGTGDVAPPSDLGKKPEPKRVDYPVAQKAPGKDGFVLSPYNNKIIDVRDDTGKPLARGTLVQDPTYLASEKKYFRVP